LWDATTSSKARPFWHAARVFLWHGRTFAGANSLPMAYRQTERVVRKLAARREAILAAACDTLAEKGIAAVQIVPVAQPAGRAAGTGYRYFPSKTQLGAGGGGGLA